MNKCINCNLASDDIFALCDECYFGGWDGQFRGEKEREQLFTLSEIEEAIKEEFKDDTYIDDPETLKGVIKAVKEELLKHRGG